MSTPDSPPGAIELPYSNETQKIALLYLEFKKLPYEISSKVIGPESRIFYIFLAAIIEHSNSNIILEDFVVDTLNMLEAQNNNSNYYELQQYILFVKRQIEEPDSFYNFTLQMINQL